MTEIKENPLFLLALLFAAITPFCFYSLLGLETLFVFGMMTLCSSLALIKLIFIKWQFRCICFQMDFVAFRNHALCGHGS
ncbi:hypothetical protein [Wielerella bovis]|uniref:hypothetical protein n=1 Tax=Wielerella bovis TaxID=2917790 RepID=UPI002018AD81|nr:hypothetical protein [Wielerella bovis]ULJ60089.1 hypothetical protein MIS44_10585 [Wielerella bovis]